jgi:hypothetical protein
MPWDVDIPISAPAATVFDLLAGWQRNRRLLKLASVRKHHLLAGTTDTEYFWLEVRDIPFKTTHCYGKRLLRQPDAVVTIFTYRFMRARELADPAGIEKLMQRDWDAFFYHTVRIVPIGGASSRLLAAEPTGDPANGTPLNEIMGFYAELRRLAEAAEDASPADLSEDDVYAKRAPTYYPPTEGDYDPYVILGISRLAGMEEVKRTYRALAMMWHPDKLADGSGPAREYAHNQFIEIATAYHTIIRSREK